MAEFIIAGIQCSQDLAGDTDFSDHTKAEHTIVSQEPNKCSDRIHGEGGEVVKGVLIKIMAKEENAEKNAAAIIIES